MSMKLYEESYISNIASAIRAKNGLATTYTVSEMASAINDIQTQGTYQSKIVNPREYLVVVTPDAGYDALSEVTVASAPLSISSFTPRSVLTTYSPPHGYYGWGDITVNAIPSSYIIPDGTVTLSSAGTFDVTRYSSATVTVTDYLSYRYNSSRISLLPSTVYDSSVSQIRPGAFMNCYNIKTFDFPSVRSVGSWAFANTSRNVYSFPSVSNIGERAFTSAAISALTFNGFPSIASIDSAAFAYCKSLRIVDLPSFSRFVRSNAFLSCSLLSTVNLPLCSAIYTSAFGSCWALESATFTNVSIIAESVFQLCYNLSYISIPSVKTIYTSAFAHCSALSSIDMPAVQSLYTYAFFNCLNLISVSVPNLVSIGSSAFYGCSNLEGIYGPSVMSVGSGAFYSCIALSYVSFPAITSSDKLRQYLFNSSIYSRLTVISMPNITRIGPLWNNTSGYKPPNLETINFNNAVSVGTNFSWLSHLKNIYLDALSATDSSMFANCTAIEMISLPGVSRINTQTFNGCTALKSVYLLYSSSMVSLMHSSAFLNTPMLDSTYLGYFGSIFVPSSMVASYKTYGVWSWFSDRIASYVE